MQAVTAFLKAHNNNLIVCDLGCGDFNIGKHLTNYTEQYVAIDIVENLIKRNKKLFKEDRLEFHCLDIAEDEIPPADCIILRQVLQHLSNAEIQKIVIKMAVFKYIILTEHIPIGNFMANKDILTGQGIRQKQNSGVNILEPPFNFKPIEAKTLGEFILGKHKGRIVTTLYKTF